MHLHFTLQRASNPTSRVRSAPVTHDSVEGTDVTIPVYSFTETYYIPIALVTGAYKATLFGLTGRTNDAGFKSFAIGKVLFLGASGSQRVEDDWEITFRFAAPQTSPV